MQSAERGAAFDAVAGQYDAEFSDTALGLLLRPLAVAGLPPAAEPTARALELNCGAGTDALFLAGRGYRVLATDVSAAMTRVAQAKAEAAGWGAQIEVKVLDINALHTIGPDAQFDLVFSNFGGLNCISAAQMRDFGGQLRRLLKPGGRAVLVVMGRICCWEILYFLLKLKPRAAFRRFGKTALRVRLGPDAEVDTWYYAPGELLDLIGRPGFENKGLQAVGFWLPPSYLNPFFEKRKRLLRALHWLELRCRGKMWAWGADHYKLTIKRLSE